MKKIKVKDLMVPLSDYASISEDASLFEAFAILEEIHRKAGDSGHRHRTILVKDGEGKVIGKLTELDALSGLEKKYDQIGDIRSISASGFSSRFVTEMMKNYDLWQRPLSDICGKGAGTRVKDISFTPIEDKYIDENAGLDEAVHRLIVGKHQSLLVVGKGSRDVVGVLQLGDVFLEVAKIMKTCEI